MVWYGIEPLIEDDLPRYVQLAAAAAIPQVRVNIARRVASSSEADRGLSLLATALADPQHTANHGDLLRGMLAGLEGRRRVTMPEGWRQAAAILDRHPDADTREMAARLALIFDDEQAVASLMLVANQPTGNAVDRNRVIDALVARRVDGYGKTLLGLLHDQAVRGAVLRGLSAYQPDGAAGEIIRRYRSWSSADKQIAISTLASRAAWADELLTAIEAGKIPAADLTAFDARQIAALENESILKRLTQIWGEVRQSPNDRAKQIAKLKSWLTADVISQGDLARGGELFKQQWRTATPSSAREARSGQTSPGAADQHRLSAGEYRRPQRRGFQRLPDANSADD